MLYLVFVFFFFPLNFICKGAATAWEKYKEKVGTPATSGNTPGVRNGEQEHEIWASCQKCAIYMAKKKVHELAWLKLMKY